MENIVSDLSSNLSKMWTKIKNIENSLFPELQEQFGILSSKEEKLIKILDFISKALATASLSMFLR